MKNILFINPPNTPITESSISIEPIDILQLATYVRDLWNSVRILDLDIHHTTSWETRVNQELFEYKPDIAICLFDYHIPLHIETVEKNVATIAQICESQKCIFIIGGKMATYMPSKFIYEGSSVTIAVRYDMEEPLKQILWINQLHHTNLKNIHNIAYLYKKKMYCTNFGKEIVKINELPIPDRSLITLDNHIDVRTMLTSRGCMMKCSFCHVPWFRWKRQWRDVSQVVDEIEYLTTTLQSKKILFLDDNATVDTKRIEAICTEIIRRNITVSRWCLSTIHSFSQALMKKMHSAWCKRIHYGIESADSTISKNIYKFLDTEKISMAVEQTKALWIRVRTSWIMDLPWTTQENLEKTLQLMEKLESDEIRVHFLANRLWSELYQEPDEILPTQYIHHNSPTQSKADIPSEQVISLVQWFIKRMHNKWYIIIDSIEKNKVFETISDTSIRCISLCPLRYWIHW